MRKLAMGLILSVLLAGCTTSVINYSPLDKPVSRIAVDSFVASNKATADLFEKVMRDKLTASGFTVTGDADVHISGIITDVYGGVVDSVIISIAASKKSIADIEYHALSSRLTIDVAKEVAQKTVLQLR